MVALMSKYVALMQKVTVSQGHQGFEYIPGLSLYHLKFSHHYPYQSLVII